MGKLLTPDVAPVGDAPLTDGALVTALQFPARFPYLNSPIPGSPNDPSITIVPQTAGSIGGGFRSVAGTYDPATRKLTVPAPGGDTGFLRLRADGKVQLENVAVEGDRISATVK
jgi:hypothetical protein